MRIKLHPRIKDDLAQAMEYYDQCTPGLGEEFFAEFLQRVTEISAAPLHWAIVRGNVRRTLMQRFRYTIHYSLVSSDVVLILVLKHQRRHPNMVLADTRDTDSREIRITRKH
jgi:toxin ParE1/3/4